MEYNLVWYVELNVQGVNQRYSFLHGYWIQIIITIQEYSEAWNVMARDVTCLRPVSMSCEYIMNLRVPQKAGVFSGSFSEERSIELMQYNRQYVNKAEFIMQSSEM
jgi:hypothetical protein